MTAGDTPDGTADPPADGTATLLRSSAVMAAGTVVSRITGFLRIVVIMAVLGSTPLSNAYNTANNAPYSIYELFLGGVLSAVLVPLFVRASKRDQVEGDLYAQRLLTLVTIVLLVLTVLSVVGAPAVMSLIANRMTGEQREIGIAFLRYLLPQILFVGVGAVGMAILQARRRFAAPMWVPVLNNLTVIAAGVLFGYVVHGQPTPQTITPAETALLGIGTSAGLVIQTLALLPALLRAGFVPRPRLGFSKLELGAISRMGTWTIVYVATNLAALFVVTNIGGAIDRVLAGQQEVNYGYTPYQNAFTVFSLPHAIVAVSVITALLPRMSSHAADERYDLVRGDLSTGIRLASVLIVPAAAAMIVLGPAVGLTIFNHGHYSAANAAFTGAVITAFGVALIPFSVFQLQLRVFYAMQDTRTPALVNLVGTAVTVLASFAAFLVLPYRVVMISLALAYAVGHAVKVLLAMQILRRRLGGVEGRVVLGAVGRMVLACVPGAVVAWWAATGITGALGGGAAGGAVAVVVGAALVLGFFVILARALRVEEVRTLVGTFRGRLGRDG